MILFENMRPLYIRLLKQDGLGGLIFPSPFTVLRQDQGSQENNCMVPNILTAV